jgi:tRNA(Arg) A34 adenosine deaminase TadA
LGLFVCGCLALGYFWFATTSHADTKLAALPVRGGSQSNGAVPSDKSKISSEEILARFPKEKHEEFMRRAIANSRKAGVEYKTGGAFGAVIVDKDGTVLADGENHVVGQNDPTWHGEMHAIRNACALLKKPKLDGCILYTSSEPCPMCLATAYWAGVDGIIYGAVVADSKKYGNFDDEFMYQQFATPAADRTISQQSLLRPEAVEVWKEYSNRSDKVDY